MKNYITTQEDSLFNIQNENSILLTRYNYIISKENGFKDMENQIVNKNKEILNEKN